MKEKHLTAITLILVAAALCFVCVVTAVALNQEATGASSPYAEAYFDPDTVNTVSITIDDDNWQDILENPLAEEYHVCNIDINGDSYVGVGIRTKGQSSLNSLASADTDRYSFKVKSDEYVQGQTFKGLHSFALNCLSQDSTLMKDYLTYALMTELGVPTPLYSYAAVYINGEYFGLYLMLESVDADFAARNFGSDYGQLYKPDFLNMGGGGIGGGRNNMPDIDDAQLAQMAQELEGGKSWNEVFQDGGFDFNAGGFGQMPDRKIGNMSRPGGFGGGGFGGGGFGGSGTTLAYIDDSLSSYSTIFDSAVYTTTSTAASNERVITALKNLNAGTDLDRYVDVNASLKFIAGLAGVVSLDSYIGSMCHNYFLYEDNGKLSMIPWDFNNAFGTFMTDARTAVNFAVDTPVSSGMDMTDRPLVSSLLAVDEYRDRYHSYMQWVGESFFGDSFADRVDRIEAMIGDYVRTDPTAFYTYDEHLAGVENLKIFGKLRGQSILGQLNGTIPSTWDGQNADSSSLIDTSSLNLNALGSFGSVGSIGGGFGGMPDLSQFDPSQMMNPPDMTGIGFGGDNRTGGMPDMSQFDPSQMMNPPDMTGIGFGGDNRTGGMPEMSQSDPSRMMDFGGGFAGNGGDMPSLPDGMQPGMNSGQQSPSSPSFS